MEPIRVLQVVTMMNRGGLETMLMNYYRQIDRSQVQFDFMVHREARGAYDDEIESLGGRIWRMPPIHPRYFGQYFTGLDRFFKEHKEYRIVHSHLDSLSTFVLRAAKLGGFPVRIAHSHNTDVADNWPRKFFKRCSRSRLAKQCTHSFACGKEAGAFLFGEDAAQKGLVVLKNAIDVEKFRFDPDVRAKLRRELGLEQNFLIGHVGNFVRQKNHFFLLELFDEARKMDETARLILMGDGVLRAQIEKRVKTMGLEGFVIFTGSVHNVCEYMMAMDCFVLPSLFEGMPVTAIEAQAAGLPALLSSKISPDVVLTKSASRLPLAAGAQKWAEELLRAKNETRHEGGYRDVLEHYDVRKHAAELTEMYLALHG